MLRWGLVCVAIVAILYAVVDSVWVSTHRDCPLGMEFERTSSQVVENRTFPPRVVCRYEYLSGADGTELFPPETKTFDAAGSWVAAFTLAAVAVVVFAVSRRSRDRRQPSPPGEGVPTS